MFVIKPVLLLFILHRGLHLPLVKTPVLNMNTCKVTVWLVSSHLPHSQDLDPRPRSDLGSGAFLLSPSPVWLTTYTHNVTKHVLFCLFVQKCPHSVISMLHIQVILLDLPPSGPITHKPEHSTQCLFFFFFQNPPIDKHGRAFFLTHIEKHDSMYFYLWLFCLFLSFLQCFVLHQGQIMYIQMLHATDKPSGTSRWNWMGVINKKIKHHERQI